MKESPNILTDSFGRKHSYLRISLTERCNLRCTYCMPEKGILLSPKSRLMKAEEIYHIAKTFVEHGVTKIRLTGGEPLVRKDIEAVIERLSSLPVELALTTNAVLADRFINLFKVYGIKNINISLDTMNSKKFKQITLRDEFERVYQNIRLLLTHKFNVKLNVVLMKDFNDDEIIDFIRLTQKFSLAVRFIEFMPFNGNRWNLEKIVSHKEIMEIAGDYFLKNEIINIAASPNDTAKNYQIKGYCGLFAVISSVTNPFCDSCNRLRLTADGKIKNCLFSSTETDLLTPLRKGKSIESIIQNAVKAKFKIRGGMDTLEKLQEDRRHLKNRTMIRIGG